MGRSKETAPSGGFAFSLVLLHRQAVMPSIVPRGLIVQIVMTVDLSRLLGIRSFGMFTVLMAFKAEKKALKALQCSRPEAIVPSCAVSD